MFLVVNHFMTIDMHRFALMWLVYSRNGGGEQFSAERQKKSGNEANSVFM